MVKKTPIQMTPGTFIHQHRSLPMMEMRRRPVLTERNGSPFATESAMSLNMEARNNVIYTPVLAIRLTRGISGRLIGVVHLDIPLATPPKAHTSLETHL